MEPLEQIDFRRLEFFLSKIGQYYFQWLGKNRKKLGRTTFGNHVITAESNYHWPLKFIVAENRC
jgi:hypothetical protein